jgi:hypothetical protein
MTKSEFLEGLRRALFSTGSNELINENINYYSSYIDEEIRKGRSEEEVVGELGDPRLLARSIKDAAGMSDEVIEETSFNNTYEENRQTYTDDYGNEINKKETIKFFNFGRTGCLIGALVLILVFIAVVSVVAYIIGGIVQLLAPVIGPILLLIVVLLFIRIFRAGD